MSTRPFSIKNPLFSIVYQMFFSDAKDFKTPKQLAFRASVQTFRGLLETATMSAKCTVQIFRAILISPQIKTFVVQISGKKSRGRCWIDMNLLLNAPMWFCEISAFKFLTRCALFQLLMNHFLAMLPGKTQNLFPYVVTKYLTCCSE